MQKLIERLTPIDLDFFKKRRRFRIKPRHVIVAFGDTWGFREWEEMRVVSSWEVWKFIEKLYQEFTDIRNGDGFFIKPMGDGLMVVVELPKDSNERSQHVKTLLRRSYRLVKSIERHIKKLPYPRPRGFRMRLVAGTVGRLEVMDTLDHQKRMVDYTGAPVSLAFNLLDVERRKSCLCHTNVKALLDVLEEKKPEIDFRYVRNPANSIRKITKRDLRSLWEFSVNK